MKNFLLMLFMYFSQQLNAQVFQTSLTSQGWAGGICCRSGVNYNLTITGNPAELEKLVVKAVCVDGHYFDHIRASPMVSNDTIASRTYSFTISSDSAIVNDPKGETTQRCSDNGKIYLEGRSFLMIESRKELEYLAYP